MDGWIPYVGGAILAALLALSIAMFGFGLSLAEAITPALIAAAVALAVVYLTD